MSESTTPLPRPTETLLKVARIATLAGLLLFFALSVWAVIMAFTDGAAINRILVENFLENEKRGSFTFIQQAIGLTLLFLTSITGIVASWIAFKLFGDYAKGNIFTRRSATRLRLIGWMIVLLAPLEIICTTLGKMLFTLWTTTGTLKIDIGIGDGSVFAVVFGLLIVVVGHVMYQAMAISDENRSFV